MEPVLRYESDLTGSQIWEGDARQVASNLPDDCASLAIFDGPYAMHKAAWDRLTVDELPEWYRPHLQDAGRLLAPSASLYFWNTAAGWAAVHPMIASMGWTFRALVTWNKTVAHMAGRVDTNGLRTWFDVTEVCGFYQREQWTAPGGAACSIAYAAGADERNWIRPWVCDEWASAGLRKPQADDACSVKCMASRHYFPADQWLFPTYEHWQKLSKYAAQNGRPRPRPYLVHPDFWTNDAGDLRATYDHLRAEYDHLQAEYDHLRAEYEASRPLFACPMGIGNVWTHAPIAGAARLRTTTGDTLHPCQKPLSFSERMIRASSRPGDTVWAPFGGTIRETVAAEQIARANPDDARQVITSELNQDGVDYLAPAIRQMRGKGTRQADPRQTSLFNAEG